MSTENNGITWRTLLDEKAESLHEQIAAAYLWVQENKPGDRDLFRSMCVRQFEWLRELYENELQLAKLLDESDLTLELIGPTVAIAHPRISVVTKTFHDVQKTVRTVAKAVIRHRDQPAGRRFQIPKDMELGLTALSRNAGLRFGFSIPEPPSRESGNLLGSEDPAFVAVSKAVEAIRDMTLSVAEADSQTDEEDISQRANSTMPDPRVRDAALIAVRELSPTKQSQVAEVRIGGREVENQHQRPITPNTRRTLNRLLSHPVKSKELHIFEGTVREMDLDSKRFDLRGISEEGIADLRCAYGRVSDKQAELWLNKKLRVTGRIDRDVSGRPRLMQVRELDFLDAPPNAQTHFEFE